MVGNVTGLLTFELNHQILSIVQRPLGFESRLKITAAYIRRYQSLRWKNVRSLVRSVIKECRKCFSNTIFSLLLNQGRYQGVLVVPHPQLRLVIPSWKGNKLFLVFFVMSHTFLLLHQPQKPGDTSASTVHNTMEHHFTFTRLLSFFGRFWCGSDQYPVAYAENFHVGGFIQWHMVVVCIWRALFVSPQFDVIFMFTSEVCWHNRHILLHILYLFL